jgi:coproporphyrinogen III oxidase-like Fe-S oxidoreductase
VQALGRGEAPPADDEAIDTATRTRERLLLGLRLDEPLPLDEVSDAFDREAAERLVAGGLVEVVGGANGDAGGLVRLTHRGRFLAGGVSAELMTLGAD